jgi:hypothetical protein
MLVPILSDNAHSLGHLRYLALPLADIVGDISIEVLDQLLNLRVGQVLHFNCNRSCVVFRLMSVLGDN